MANAQFYTVGRAAGRTYEKVQRTVVPVVPVMGDSVCADPVTNDYSCLSISQLQDYIERLEKIKQKRERKGSNSDRILAFYQGVDHELSPVNIWRVCDEVGVTHKNYVIAQSILETGRYTSRICKEYHNIFGLYDSVNKDYYHFKRWEDSVVAYKKFIQYKYKSGNYLDFLKKIGYAEDRTYEAKLVKIMKSL